MKDDPRVTGRILALDQSTTAVGWLVAIDDQYLASGTFRPHSRDAWERLRQAGAWLEQMVADWQPEAIVAEEPAGDHGNRRSDRLLGAALGIVLERARIAGVPCRLVHPMAVKKTGLHKGTRRYVAPWLGLTRRVSGDEADAVGVWQAARAWR